LRFFSPPEKPSLTAAAQQRLVHLEQLRLLADELQELHRVELGLPRCLRMALSAAFRK
jgi:hypothetical protein